MTWIAIDPAFSVSNYMGWAIGGTDHDILEIKKIGLLSLNKPVRGPRKRSKAADRISGIEYMISSLRDVCDLHKVTQVLFEWPGGTQSATAATSLTTASVSVFVFAMLTKRDFIYITPSGMKKAVTGNRFAEKEAVIAAVAQYYPIISTYKTKRARETVADVLGIALAIHLHQQGTQFYYGEPYE